MAKSNVYLGDINISEIKVGNYDVEMYIGDTKAYPLSKPIDDAVVTCASATYNGSNQVAQTITVTLGGETLVAGTDYTVTQNTGGTNAGSYPVVVTGMGNYEGTASGTFTINKASRTISFTTAPTDVAVGKTITVVATPSAGSGDGTITYISNNTSVATVNGNVITGVGSGSAMITAIISDGANYTSARVDYTLTVVPNYLCFEVKTGGNIKWSGSTTANTLSYSKNKGATWTSVNSADTITVSAGDKVLWKGTPTPQISGGIGKFSAETNVKYDVKGNVMSLLYGDNFEGQLSLEGKGNNVFQSLFSRTNVVNASNMELPATTLTSGCYREMFSGCTSLTTAPSELPAISAISNTYSNMFSGCTSLTTAPELPATTVTASAYMKMFAGCTSLTTAPEICAETMSTSACSAMFSGCTSLTTAPSKLPATTLATACYGYMFADCTSLTTAPELPATALANKCYSYMFSRCKSLNYIKAMFTTTPSTSYTNGWVNNVASSGTFVMNSAASWNTGTTACGTSTYPCNWTVTTASS